jgi:hypothetical protein
MNNDRFQTPAAILHWYVARASYDLTGHHILTEVLTLGELLDADRGLIEHQMNWAEDSITETTHSMTRWGLLGIFPTHEEARAATEWVDAWSRGS